MIPDWAKELLKATGVQVPGMIVMGILFYFVFVGAMREATIQNKESTKALGEAAGIMRWANIVLSRNDPDECCRPRP